MKTYPRCPQVITIFIPVFGKNIVKLRSHIISDDWVEDCYELDKKYGIWFTTMSQAKALLKENPFIDDVEEE